MIKKMTTSNASKKRSRKVALAPRFAQTPVKEPKEKQQPQEESEVLLGSLSSMDLNGSVSTPHQPSSAAPSAPLLTTVTALRTTSPPRRSTQQQAQLLRELFVSQTCRCFVLKSFSEANFHKSLKYGLWTSTVAHNLLLDQIFTSELASIRPILFFFSVCDTRHFSGIARMKSRVVSEKKFLLWEKTKYDGYFEVEWLLVKDVPNHVLRGIHMTNDPAQKSITTCRDCDEVPFSEAQQFIEAFISYDHQTSAWDDFAFFDALQVELERKRCLSTQIHGDSLASFLVPCEPKESRAKPIATHPV